MPALVTALSRLLRSSMARRCVVEATAVAPYVVPGGKVRLWKFWVAVNACGSPGLGVGWEAFLTKGRASTPLPQVTWSGPAIVPEESRSQPAVGEVGLLMVTFRVVSGPVMVSVVPLAPGNRSLRSEERRVGKECR